MWVPGLDGSGTSVAQPEAGNPDPHWQVDPALVGLPVERFRWIASSGSTNGFPNNLGMASGHASQVGQALYGSTDGVAPGVAYIENYEAVYFVGLIQSGLPINPPLVNQSFAFGGQNQTIDLNYDNYVNVHGTLFVSGVGNSGAPASPATMWNGIGVGAFGGASSFGPTSDGRCKPDLTAPGVLTSFATPQVVGTAALLLQAITNGVVPAGDAALAADWRTLKALLLNGADKPAGWTNAVAYPLDARYGTGLLNVFRTYDQLRGGRRLASATNTFRVIDPVPIPSSNHVITARRGWNMAAISHGPLESAVHSYLLDSSASGQAIVALVATLNWALPVGGTAANNLDLVLADADTGAVLAESRSPKNNVEHLHVINLPAGRYLLQVLKLGGALESVTRTETYALAFEAQSALTPGPRWADSAWEASVFRATLEGEPSETYAVERAPDAVTWMPVTTHQMGATGVFAFEDPTASPAQSWIYRARRLP